MSKQESGIPIADAVKNRTPPPKYLKGGGFDKTKLHWPGKSTMGMALPTAFEALDLQPFHDRADKIASNTDNLNHWKTVRHLQNKLFKRSSTQHYSESDVRFTFHSDIVALLLELLNNMIDKHGLKRTFQVIGEHVHKFLKTPTNARKRKRNPRPKKRDPEDLQFIPDLNVVFSLVARSIEQANDANTLDEDYRSALYMELKGGGRVDFKPMKAHTARRHQHAQQVSPYKRNFTNIIRQMGCYSMATQQPLGLLYAHEDLAIVKFPDIEVGNTFNERW